MSNRWELYSSMSGWEAASQSMDQAFETGVKAAEEAVARGESLPRAALNAVRDVGKEFSKFREFGGIDSEPMYLLEARIKRHFEKRYGIELDL